MHELETEASRDLSTLNARDLGIRMRPVFIGGLPRSGTSLMRAVIGSHPNIAMSPRDLQWTTRVFPRYPGNLSERRWQSMLDELFSLKQTESLGLDLARMKTEAAEMARNPLQLMGVLLSAYADRLDRPRWGVKTPLLELYADDLLTQYPNARIIHVVRDPRDMCSSIMRRGYYGPLRRRIMDSVAWMTMNWKQSARIAVHRQMQNPACYRVVHYEKFVADAVESLKELCEFIGEEFDPGMLDMPDFADFRDRGGNSSFAPISGISAAPVGRFRQHLRPSKVRICELVAGREFTRMGYQLSRVELPSSERMRLSLVEWPLAVIQIGLRAGLHVMRSTLPRIFERRPLPLIRDT